MLGIGAAQELRAYFTPSDAINYAWVTKTTTIDVNPFGPIITAFAVHRHGRVQRRRRAGAGRRVPVARAAGGGSGGQRLRERPLQLPCAPDRGGDRRRLDGRGQR
ncbi:MAG: hypothetical protein MZV64_42925 [Ignavibacteriales bacterium]|nr:hypothetical protein [Ignavibacteriales bacterium]